MKGPACLLALLLGCGPLPAAGGAPLELSRAVRPWEFLSAVGPKAALLGTENGRLEAWVYPLKLFKDFHLRFRCGGRTLEGEALVRTVTVRPEATTLVYAWDTFRVEETLCVPPDAAGALVSLAIETSQPLEIEAVFTRDFQLQWPAAFGGADQEWVPAARAFQFSEPGQHYAAMVGSPEAAEGQSDDLTNYAATPESCLRLARVAPGRGRQTLILAASVNGAREAEATYRRLAEAPQATLDGAAAWYRRRLDASLGLELPEADLQQAYDWARVSLIQGMVENPLLGTGLVAGYRTSGNDYRPGFAWFFGRDALWSGLALDAAGDPEATRTALAFLARYQRADGKIPHEVSQSASLVPWFKDLPWAWAAADATPLFLITLDDYVTRTGDTAFAATHWDALARAWQWLGSTRNRAGFPTNGAFGTGWVEGGPLYAVETELYQSAVGLAACRALGHLAGATGHAALARDLAATFAQGRAQLNRAFWLEGPQRFAFGLAADGTPLDAPSVEATVPMLFGLLDAPKADAMLRLLAGPEHQTDWGMRILSAEDPRYDPGGYHNGSVWPLFTGWAALGEYRCHRALPACTKLRANAALATAGSAGHFTEVLSGAANQGLSTASPHQIWSAAMVAWPLVTGLLGLEGDALASTLTFAPHLPAGWRHLAIRRARVGADRFDLELDREEGRLALRILPSGPGSRRLVFAPAFSPRARVTAVLLDGRPAPFEVTATATDQHVTVTAQVAGAPRTLEILSTGDFALDLPAAPLSLGAPSRGLRVVAEAWSADRASLALDLAGPAGATFDLEVWNPGAVLAAEGATLTGNRLQVTFPGRAADTYVHRPVRLLFRARPPQAAP